MRDITLGATYSVSCSTAHKTDAATGEHGDLLDLIRLRCAFGAVGDAMDEARVFLAMPRPETGSLHRWSDERGSTPEAARRLFRASRPICGTPAEAYLRARGITVVGLPTLRFHPSVYFRADDRAPLCRLPAMLAAVTELDGRVVGVNGPAPASLGRRSTGGSGGQRPPSRLGRNGGA